MEPQELSPALLQPQVTVVAILGELLATLPRRDKMMLVSTADLYWDLVNFTKDLWVTLSCIDGAWWRQIVTSDDDDAVTSLSQTLANYESTPGTTWDDVTMAARKWHRSVSVLVHSWAELARKATQLHDTCTEVVTEVADMVAIATARARKLQRRAGRDGTAQENTMELGQALGEEEDWWCKARARREAMVAASKAARASVVREDVEAALGLLPRLVATCDRATLFSWNMEWQLRDIEAILTGTNEVSPDVLQALMAKVAKFEQLWEASTRLAKEHLLGTLEDIDNLLLSPCGDRGGPGGPGSRAVAERCHKAIEDIPRLLQESFT
ncbi:uncharacterized protein LOC115949191 [Geospiza fortis]|uniref:Uncharacterized protein LOC115949191 n=1 Tax=Geospiza fortis TaxID=48883 RepID=A0A8N5F524_GEOFO|nr:uncharacterized protein LOC115949191 [Geospiza fortis]